MTIPFEKMLCTKYGNPLLLQQPSSNPVILPSTLAISHVQPSHTSVYTIIDPSP